MRFILWGKLKKTGCKILHYGLSIILNRYNGQVILWGALSRIEINKDGNYAETMQKLCKHYANTMQTTI
jgi:hypothetical protein